MTTAERTETPRAGALPTTPGSWAHFPAFMEVQFPVSKVSKESYNERKAVAGQTLTALGKWWGRKPLVLVRATILGLLLPATENPKADREVFLALMTMDDDGMLRRLDGNLPAAKVYEHCTAAERAECFDMDSGKPKWKRATVAGERTRLQRLALLRMGYDERLKHCKRPEEIDGPSPEAWAKVNAHLGTSAASLPQLMRELGERRFAHVPRVADAFCGGGSIPFEAARIGCEAYGSDLNPVAALLSWGAVNIIGGGREVVRRVQEAQRRVHEAVCRQVDEFAIESDAQGATSDIYLYFNVVRDPSTGWDIPLASSWVIGQRTRTYARLAPNPVNKTFHLEIVTGAEPSSLASAAAEGTWKEGLRSPIEGSGRWLSPNHRTTVGLAQLRGRTGLRRWDNSDLMPRADDVFQEEVFCIRWDERSAGKRWRATAAADKARDRAVVDLLRERWARWQESGSVPTSKINLGGQNLRPTVGRGWTYWHHLYHPRQLLQIGLFSEEASLFDGDLAERVGLLLSVGRLANWNSRLTGWISAIEATQQTFYAPSLHSPLVQFPVRSSRSIESVVRMEMRPTDCQKRATVELRDARTVDFNADLWITDPGYGDVVPYGELSELFLAWYEKALPKLFPDWYVDSKRALSVEGDATHFGRAMVECYSRFTQLMPDNGLQLVMFTHSDAEVWADVALSMWAAGLHVCSAWTVATETAAAGLKQGNYVQGTVLLVLRKRLEERRGDMSDLYPDLQAEVQAQLQSMLALDDKEDPNFSDADYQLAAYAAALRVLTAYSSIDEIDVQRELTRVRARGEKSPLVALIERAVRIASDVLVPAGLDRGLWRKLGPEERFYLKGVEVEANGDYREGVYQEYARGYGVREYRPLLGSGTANQVRIKTPSEFKARDLGGEGFGGSLLRQVLFAVYKTAEAQDPRVGRDYLKMELAGYWEQRQSVLALLAYLAEKPKPDYSMAHWKDDVEAAQLLRGSIENDSV